jgi:hypothetical protein
MTKEETAELADIADDLAQIPHPMAEELLETLNNFLRDYGSK